MQNIRSFYNDRICLLQSEVLKQHRKLTGLSVMRLLAFLAIAVALFVITPQYLLAGIIMSLLCIIIFLFLIKTFQKNQDRYKHLNALLNQNQLELKALDHDYSGFQSGKEFEDTQHPYSYDMDLFGEGSIFQYLNRSVTFKGKQHLASLLSQATLDKELIVRRQEAIHELRKMTDLRQDFCASGSYNDDSQEDIQVLYDWVKQPFYYLHRKWLWYLSVISPIVTITVAITAIFIPVFRIPALLLYIIQWIYIGMRNRHTTKEHIVISKRLGTLQKYTQLLAHVDKTDFHSYELKRLSETFFSGENSAFYSVRKLSTVVSAFDQRLNFLAAIFLEGFLLWDLHCMIRLEKWKSENGKNLQIWFDALAEFDALISLSTFAFNHPDYCFPNFSDKCILDTNSLGHILIPPEQRVCNHFKINRKGDFVIITGANMAGKSTFLRTITTNLILAMTGAPVCAEKFSFQPVRLFSSMRTTDSLNKHESYFYAELVRLKSMLESLEKDSNLFIVLDEILKGTNSLDKQRGSRAVLERIIQLNGTGIIATHDLELAKIEEIYPDRIFNYCFEIEIEDAQISFDYLLQPGITKKMNAYLLMQQMGIVQK